MPCVGSPNPCPPFTHPDCQGDHWGCAGDIQPPPNAGPPANPMPTPPTPPATPTPPPPSAPQAPSAPKHRGGPTLVPPATGGGFGGLGFTPKFAEDPIDKQIRDYLSGIITTGPYGPRESADIYAGIVTDAESARLAGREGVYSDLARRGLFRSAAGDASARAVDLEAARTRSEGLRAARIDIVQKNFEARMGAIDRAQKWLDSLRAEMNTRNMTNLDRAKAEANLRLAYAQLAQQKELTEKQLAAAGSANATNKEENAANLTACTNECASYFPGDGNCVFNCHSTYGW